MFTGTNRYDHYAPSAALVTRPNGYYMPPPPQNAASMMMYATTPRRPNLLDNAFADEPLVAAVAVPVKNTDVALGQFLVDVVNGAVDSSAILSSSSSAMSSMSLPVEEYHTRHANGTEFRFQTSCRSLAHAGFWLEALHQQCMRNTTDRAAAARRALDWVHAHFAPHVVSEAEMLTLVRLAVDRHSADVRTAKAARAAMHEVPGLAYLLRLVGLLSADDTTEVVRQRYLDASVLGDLVLESIAETRVGLAKIVHLVRVLDVAPPAGLAAQSIRMGYLDGLELALRHGQVPGPEDMLYTKRVDCPNGANMRALLDARGIFMPVEEEEEKEKETSAATEGKMSD